MSGEEDQRIGHHRDAEDWLEAEAAGAADAEARFAAMVAVHLPRLGPAHGFADRVMSALPAPLSTGVRSMPRWERAAVFVLLSAGGLGAAAFWSTPVFDLITGAGLVVARGAGLLAVAATWLRTLAHGWAATVSIGRAMALVAGSGPASTIMAANLALALVASIALKHLLSPEERTS